MNTTEKLEHLTTVRRIAKESDTLRDFLSGDFEGALLDWASEGLSKIQSVQFDLETQKYSIHEEPHCHVCNLLIPLGVEGSNKKIDTLGGSFWLCSGCYKEHLESEVIHRCPVCGTPIEVEDEE